MQANHISKTKSFWKLYKNTFFPKFTSQRAEEKIHWKLQKEEYIGFLAFIKLIYIYDLSEFIFGTMGYLEIISFTIANIILLYCVKRGKLQFLKILFCIICCGIGYFWTMNNPSHILGGIVLLALAPSLCLILTRSIIKSMIVYCINLLEAFIFFLPLMGKILAFHPNDPRSKIMIPFISANFANGLIMVIVCWILFNSRKKMIMKLIEQKKDVEHLNTTLIKKNKELENFAEKRYNLLLSVSHEVRNPLNVISGTTDLALMDDPNPKILAHLNTIKISSELMLYLINNLLDYSKLDKYDLIICSSRILTTKFMEDIWNISKVLIKKKNLFGQMFVSKNMPRHINIDEKRILQIIYNLVGNASKFTTNGYISIICTWININKMTKSMALPTSEDEFRSYLNEKSGIQKSKSYMNLRKLSSDYMLVCLKDASEDITNNSIEDNRIFEGFQDYFLPKVPKTLSYKKLFDNYNILKFEKIELSSKKLSTNDNESEQIIKTKEDKGGYLKIEIIDSGCGIKSEYFQDIFTKFTQVGSETQNRLGTGLGLWIAKNICHKMNGDLNCYSVVNRGTIFVGLVKSEEVS